LSNPAKQGETGECRQVGDLRQEKDSVLFLNAPAFFDMPHAEQMKGKVR